MSPISLDALECHRFFEHANVEDNVISFRKRKNEVHPISGVNLLEDSYYDEH